MKTEFRAGFVGVLGLPNAGKSSLINALIGEKITIVSPLPQTTRQRIRGVYNDESTQMVFVDAPGFLNGSQKGLHSFLNEEFKDVLNQSDVLLVVLSPDEGKHVEEKILIERALSAKKPTLVLINKIDLKLDTAAIKTQLHKLKVETVVEVSALWPREQLQKAVAKKLTEMLPVATAPLYDTDLFTLEKVRDLAAELIRERAFHWLKQELPYSLAVRVLKFEDEDPSLTKISAEILVSKVSHRGIVVGLGGQMIKRIGSEARTEIEQLIDKKVFLDLHVTCKPQWMKRPEIMKELGYVAAGT